MKNGWEYKKIGEIFNVERGGSPRPIQKYLTNSPDGINWIKISDATSSTKYIYETKEKITKEGLKKTRLVKEGDFLLSNSMSFGRPYIMKTTGCIHDGWLVLHDTKRYEIDQDFLYYILCSPNIFFQFDTLAAGSTVRNLNIALASSVEIPLPPLPEQKHIVAILDEAFAAIDKAKANAEKNLANAKELFESYLNGVFANPGEDWEIKSFGDNNLMTIIDGDRGKNYPKKKDFSPEGHCLFMNTKNVRPNGFDFSEKMFITQEKDKSMGKGKIQYGDVIMTTRGTIGNIGVYDKSVPFEQIRINSGMLIFRPNADVLSSNYLFEILRSGLMKLQINRHVSGAAQPQLPIKTLVKFKIPIPKLLEKQNQIVDSLKLLGMNTTDLESNYRKKITDLEELKKSLLKKAFEGEL